MKQEEKVLKHLKLVGHITPLEALEVHGVYRLSAIIFNLRKKGYPIVTHIMTYTNSDGEIHKYANYTLRKGFTSKSK